MRRMSIAAVMVGLVLVACGGEEAQTPKTPTPPVATTPPPPPVVEAPKEEPKPQPTMAELQKKSGMEMGAAMNAHDAKKLASLYADNAVVKVAGAPDTTGKDGVQSMYQKLFDAFPNFKSAASRMWMKGDVVVVEWAFNGTQTGELHGIKGTEKPAGAMGVDVMWYGPDGLVKEQHTYYDAGTVMSQIGVSKEKARGIPALASSPQVFVGPGADETKNADVAKAMMGAFESKKEADFLGTLSDNVEWDDMTQPQTSKGKDEAKKAFQMMTKAFPDAKMTVNNVWAVGDFVIAETTMTGTHKGALGKLPATKKSVNLHGIDIHQFKDGKLAKGWSYGNSMEFMGQLGLLPQPNAKTTTGDKKPATTAPATGDKKPATTAPATGDKKPATTAPKK